MTVGRNRRSVVFPVPGRDQGHRRRAGELSARVAALREEARAATGTDLPAHGAGGGGSAETVALLTRHCIERLRDVGADSGPGSDAEAERLSRVIIGLQELSFDLYRHDLNARTRRLADCSAGLARLRALPSSADLLDQVCEELVERCGFGRAVLSRVENGIWRPWMAYFSDGGEFQAWFTDWIDQGIPLEEAPMEERLLTERRPALIHDTSTMLVHRPIIVEAGRSESYVVAPVTGGPDVVGFLHADHHPSEHRADEVDRDVLWAFAVGFGHIYERMVLMERLCAQRDHAREILSSSVRMMDEICDAGIGLGGGAPEPRARVSTAPAFGELTKRETEVLELMIEGAANGAIAEQLIITEDTVKSHVKHILRKLGVANRSQAIAISLGLAPPDGAR